MTKIYRRQKKEISCQCFWKLFINFWDYNQISIFSYTIDRLYQARWLREDFLLSFLCCTQQFKHCKLGRSVVGYCIFQMFLTFWKWNLEAEGDRSARCLRLERSSWDSVSYLLAHDFTSKVIEKTLQDASDGWFQICCFFRFKLHGQSLRGNVK